MNIKLKYQSKLQLIVLIGIVFLLFSCTPQEKDTVDRGLKTFAVFMWEIVNFVIFGLTALTLSIIVFVNRKPTLRIIATIFTAIYVLFLILGLIVVVNIPPPGFYIYMVFTIFFFVAAICGVLTGLAKPKDKLAHIDAVDFEVIKDEELE